MLRAALIGFGSSGKTTLFQLMTSARETARAAHGKGETTVGISKVPDARLDRLTAMYNPRKRVPATVEFTDIGVAERRLERLDKDLKKVRSPDLEREREVIQICKASLEDGKPLRALDLKGEDLKR